jgi:hypothetical protein
MTKVDDKSGYDYVSLKESSYTFFGIQFAGWYFVYTTLPFGLKASAYIYQSTGLVPKGYCRSLGINILQYIYDIFVGEINSTRVEPDASAAKHAIFIVCGVLHRLGYTLGLPKCIFLPTQRMEFLGMIIDSTRQSFIVPKRKVDSFSILREHILNSPNVDVKTLKRFSDLAIPAAKIYTIEVNRCISQAVKCSRLVQIDRFLREELEHWIFLDNWHGFSSWRKERHLQLVLASDASHYKWGASVTVEKGKSVNMGDFWEAGDKRAIHVKERDALLRVLKAVENKIKDHRVDAYVDYKALISVWERHGRKDPKLNRIVKELYQMMFENNVDLKLIYIPSKDNPADKPSRSIFRADCTLSEKKLAIWFKENTDHIQLILCHGTLMQW